MEGNTCIDIAQWTLPSVIVITLLALTFIPVKHNYSKKIFEIQQSFFGTMVKNSICTFLFIGRIYMVFCVKTVNSFYIILSFKNVIAHVDVFSQDSLITLYDLTFYPLIIFDDFDKLSSVVFCSLSSFSV